VEGAAEVAEEAAEADVAAAAAEADVEADLAVDVAVVEAEVVDAVAVVVEEMVVVAAEEVGVDIKVKCCLQQVGWRQATQNLVFNYSIQEVGPLQTVIATVIDCFLLFSFFFCTTELWGLAKTYKVKRRFSERVKAFLLSRLVSLASSCRMAAACGFGLFLTLDGRDSRFQGKQYLTAPSFFAVSAR
jgi:hypothetical protein